MTITAAHIPLAIVIGALLLSGIAFVIYVEIALVRAFRWSRARCLTLLAISLAFPVVPPAIYIGLEINLPLLGLPAGRTALIITSALIWTTITAITLWWMTQSSRVAVINLLAGVLFAGFTVIASWRVSSGNAYGMLFILLGVLITWHGATGHALWTWSYSRAAEAVGFCKNCGYSLGGLHTSKCPECGAPYASPIRIIPASMLPPPDEKADT